MVTVPRSAPQKMTSVAVFDGSAFSSSGARRAPAHRAFPTPPMKNGGLAGVARALQGELDLLAASAGQIVERERARLGNQSVDVEAPVGGVERGLVVVLHREELIVRRDPGPQLLPHQGMPDDVFRPVGNIGSGWSSHRMPGSPSCGGSPPASGSSSNATSSSFVSPVNPWAELVMCRTERPAKVAPPPFSRARRLTFPWSIRWPPFPWPPATHSAPLPEVSTLRDRRTDQRRTNGVGTTVPASALPRTSTVTAVPSSTSGGRNANAMPCPSTGE